MLGSIYEYVALDGDQRAAVRGFRFAIFLTILVIMFLCAGLNEVRYRLLGTRADADVVTVFTTRDKELGLLKFIRFDYRDGDAPPVRMDEQVPNNWWPAGKGELQPGDTVEVVYLSGIEESARLVGRENNTILMLFLFSLAMGSFAFWLFWRWASAQANIPSRRSGYSY
ncbi:hypothetical protein [Calycomorphotria hydatis]|uniref:DUF3592 domain-containing protein n=1 Tax=Calycomorphotria hydatis TaxID=2528027 RepID=A0A517TER1_9PLAN|nr:hypothetical protein [Calycomorphotria hydatis]QDT66856.1 hypothetical protein V22_41280 [Calycomorphotria hydatis]